MVGNRESNEAETGGVEPQAVHPLVRHALGHGPAHHVPGGQFVDEALPVGVAEQGPVPAQRLGQQGPGHRRVVERGGVELHELHVGHGHAGPQGHGQAVGGGLGRVGGHREQLAGPAGGQHRVGGPDLDQATLGAEGHARPGTGRPPPAGRGRTTPPARRRPWPAWRRPAPAPPRPRWPPRRRGPPAAVEWPPSRARARAPPGWRSKTAPMAISSLTRAGPSSTSTRTASVSHRPAPAARVSARWRSVESSSPPSTAATPPWAHRVADWDSSALVSTPTRNPLGAVPVPVGAGGAASRTAADRPATPLPRTSTSRATGATSGSARAADATSGSATARSVAPTRVEVVDQPHRADGGRHDQPQGALGGRRPGRRRSSAVTSAA